VHRICNWFVAGCQKLASCGTMSTNEFETQESINTETASYTLRHRALRSQLSFLVLNGLINVEEIKAVKISTNFNRNFVLTIIHTSSNRKQTYKLFCNSLTICDMDHFEKNYAKITFGHIQYRMQVLKFTENTLQLD